MAWIDRVGEEGGDERGGIDRLMGDGAAYPVAQATGVIWSMRRTWQTSEDRKVRVQRKEVLGEVRAIQLA